MMARPGTLNETAGGVREPLPPPLKDARPWAQGFNDYLAFGKAAAGYDSCDPGFAEYEVGKSDARLWCGTDRAARARMSGPSVADTSDAQEGPGGPEK